MGSFVSKRDLFRESCFGIEPYLESLPLVKNPCKHPADPVAFTVCNQFGGSPKEPYFRSLLLGKEPYLGSFFLKRALFRESSFGKDIGPYLESPVLESPVPISFPKEDSLNRALFKKKLPK